MFSKKNYLKLNLYFNWYIKVYFGSIIKFNYEAKVKDVYRLFYILKNFQLCS